MTSAGQTAPSTGYAAVRIKCTVPSRRHLWDVLASRQEKSAKSRPAIHPHRETLSAVEGLAAFASMHIGTNAEQQRSSHPFLKTLQARPGVIFEESGYERRTFQRGTPMTPADPRGLLGHYVVAQMIEEEAMDAADAETHIIALAVGYEQRSSKYVIWDPPESDEERRSGLPTYHLVPQSVIAKFPRRRQYFKGQDVIARWPVATLPPDLSAEQLIRREWTSALYPAEIVRGIDLNLIEIRYSSEELGSSKRVHVLDVALRPKDGEPDEAELRRMKKQKRKQREKGQPALASAGVGVSERPRSSSPSGKASAGLSCSAYPIDQTRSAKPSPGESPTGASPPPRQPAVADARHPVPPVNDPSPQAAEAAEATPKIAAAAASDPTQAAGAPAESRLRDLEGARVAQRGIKSGPATSGTEAKPAAPSKHKLERSVKLEAAAVTEVPNPAVAMKPAPIAFRIPKLERSQAKPAADVEAPPSRQDVQVDAIIKSDEQADRIPSAAGLPSLGSLQSRVPLELASRSPAPAAAERAGTSLPEPKQQRSESTSRGKSPSHMTMAARGQSPPATNSRAEQPGAPAAAPGDVRGTNGSLLLAGPGATSFRIPKQSAEKASRAPTAPPAPSCAPLAQRSTRESTAPTMSAPLMVLKPQSARAVPFDASSMHSPMSQPPTPSPSHHHSRTEAALRHSVPASQQSFGRVRRRSVSGLHAVQSLDQPPSPPPEELVQDLRTWRTVLGIDPAPLPRQKKHSPASTPAAAEFACQKSRAQPEAVAPPAALSERLRIEFKSGRKRPRHLARFGCFCADRVESRGPTLPREQARALPAPPVTTAPPEVPKAASASVASEAVPPVLHSASRRGVSSSSLLEEPKNVFKALLVL